MKADELIAEIHGDIAEAKQAIRDSPGAESRNYYRGISAGLRDALTPAYKLADGLRSAVEVMQKLRETGVYNPAEEKAIESFLQNYA